ncbi:hypothetical protein XENTR_v10021425 [Xenopus tropicalis]|uniref:Heterogeneous nuclear ribonucleoprotein U-like protein 1 isoform X1 n=1 Tax=Xenopus tropicalis TaxID=8364 RepID=A0A8J0QSY3_XENTR|nr:heterogeneous nuclear ribonucleoprotein U-like protein 1 isoform X1 [Xenopus tropicalis]KAE8585719.1 hypothetical protein XENTR_v10021425 [Xenopus tropicalis]
MGDHQAQYHRGGYPAGPPRDYRREGEGRYYGNQPSENYGMSAGFPPFRQEGIKQERDQGYDRYDRRPAEQPPPPLLPNMALKTEFKQEQPDPGYRGPNAASNQPQFQNRKRGFEDRGHGYYEHRDERRARSPQGSGFDDDDVFDENVVVLDNYNSDLHFKLDKDRTVGYPLTIEGFAYLWSGARATHGVNRGRVCFEMKVTEKISVGHLPSNEPDPHVVRVGWSLDSCSTQLGEEPFSYGYGGTGKKSSNSRFENYGETFAEHDVIGCYIDFESHGDIEMSFSKNGQPLGVAFRVHKETLGSQALFPHILVKNCTVEFNFGQRPEPFCSAIPGFTFIQHVQPYERVRGTEPPKNKAECEILMMVGLPGAGKTTWAVKHAAAHPEKKYVILGTNAIMEKMRVMGLRRQRNYAGRWDVLIQQATQCLNRLIQIAARRKRNYILDQTNVYGTAQKRKMRPFEGFQRKAIIICPTDADLQDRIVKRTDEEGKDVPDSAVLEMKANFALPEPGDFLDEVIYVELQKEDAEPLVRQYNEEGKRAGPPPEKRFRGRGGGPPGGGVGRGDGKGRDGGGRGDGGARGDFQRFDSPLAGHRGGFQGRGGGNSAGGYRGGAGGFNRDGHNQPQSRWSGSSHDNGSESRGGYGASSQQQHYYPGGSQGGGYGNSGPSYGNSGPSSNSLQSAPNNYSQGQNYGQGGYNQGGGSGYGPNYNNQSYNQGYNQPPPNQSSSPAQLSNSQSNYSQQYQQQQYGGQQWGQYQSQASPQNPSSNQGPSHGQGQWSHGPSQGQGQWSQWHYGSGGYDPSGRYGSQGGGH